MSHRQGCGSMVCCPWVRITHKVDIVVYRSVPLPLEPAAYCTLASSFCESKKRGKGCETRHDSQERCKVMARLKIKCSWRKTAGQGGQSLRRRLLTVLNIYVPIPKLIVISRPSSRSFGLCKTSTRVSFSSCLVSSGTLLAGK